MVRAEAMAATSTTRKNRDARSLSMFSPKLRALPSGRSWVAMRPSNRAGGWYPPRAPRIILHCEGRGQEGRDCRLMAIFVEELNRDCSRWTSTNEGDKGKLGCVGDALV